MNHENAHFDRFVEQLGLLAEGEGLPRTAGRMMGVLMVCSEPMGIDELATTLKVSRASISTNSRLLQSLQIADLVREPGDRRDYLQISGDSCSSLLTLGLHRMQSMRRAVRQMRLALNGAAFSTSRGLLKRMEQLYDLAIEQAQSVLSLWRKSHLGKSVSDNAAPPLLPRTITVPPGRKLTK
jgi:DNA-binding transcriptional regulator GbsR (MarR family)